MKACGCALCLLLILSGCTADIWELTSSAATGFGQIKETGTIYVSVATGNDGWPGTRANPKKSIQEAVYLMNRIRGAGNVCVAEGFYSLQSPLVIVDGVSVYGGFSASTWERQPQVHQTVLVAQFYYTIYAAGGISRATVLDGFVIHASGTQEANWAIYCFNASPTISGNVIQGGATYDYVGAIDIKYGSPLVIGNDVYGGESSWSTGIYVSDAAPEIVANTIQGGKASGTACGVYCSGSSNPVLRNNVIQGGSGTTTVGVMLVDATRARVQSNTVFAGNGSSVSTAISNQAAGSYLVNNILTADPAAATTCGIETAASCSESGVFNNDFHDTQSLYTYNGGAFTAPGVAEMESFLAGQGEPSGGNVEMDPMFANPQGGDWHLTASTPPEVADGAADLSAEFTTDLDGKARTVPWSIGAYERDP
jgi:parallel beta-helix repeat protein